MALQICLPLNKDTRNTGLDNSILVNTANFSSSSEKSVVGTKSGKFSGTNPQLYFSPVANIINGKQNFSVALWAYQLKSANQLLFAFLKNYFAFALWNNGLYVRTQATGDGSSATYAPHRMIELPTTNINKWTHYVCTFDKGTCKVYIDGNFHGSGHTTDNDSMLTTLDKAYVGHWNSSYPFSGYVEDFRVYDNTVTEEDVKRIYNCKIMDICASSYNGGFFYDNSGLLINDLVSTAITYSGNSMYFNGSTSQIRPKDGTSGLNISGGTLSVWFKPLSKPSDFRIVYIDSKSKMALGFYNSNYFIVVTSEAGSKSTFSNANLTYNQLNNVIISYDQSYNPLYCYVNGVKAATAATNYLTETAGLTIGGRQTNTANKFNGYISKVTVYRNQLTEDEAKQLYAIGPQTETDFSQNYTRLEYLEATGTQYIDTNFNPSNNTRVVTELMPTTNNNAMGFFGSYPNNDFNTSSYGLYYSSSNGLAYSNFNSDSSFDRSKIEYGKKHFVDKNKNLLYIDNELVLTHTSATFQSTIPLHIFKLNFSLNPRYAKLRVYDFKIYENNDLVRHFIPSKRNSDNVLGMYDLVSQTFFTNAGSGYFIAGPEFGTKLPSAYQQVEYLESADGVNCYINTNFKPNNNTRLTTTVYPTSDNTNAHFYFGSRNGSSTSQAFGVYQSGNKTTGLYALWNNSGNISLGSNFSGQKKYYIDLDKNVLTINGVVAKTFTNGTFTGTYNVFLFAMNTSGYMDGQKGGQRMEITRIYDNGILVRNMIPCYRKSDNVKGMYDTVNNVFYTNTGSGTFTAGPAI